MKYKKALVTGSSGFIGSHIVDELKKNKFQVVLFDSVSSKYNLDNDKEIIGDLLNIEDIKRAAEGCDVIFHLAAQADIQLSSETPLETVKNNIIGTQNLLEVARTNEINRFVFASTVYVYSELGSFYRVSKQACEKIIEEYKNQFNTNYTILRYGSLYGPRANKFNAINSFLIQALKNKKIIRKSNGEELREYIHVMDAAKLSVKSLDSKYENRYLIITGNQQIKVKNLLTMINEIFNNKIEVIFSEQEELHHYQITPYNYRPQVAEKISQNLYHDLGQGLIEQIYNLDSELSSSDKIQSISLRKK